MKIMKRSYPGALSAGMSRLKDEIWPGREQRRRKQDRKTSQCPVSKRETEIAVSDRDEWDRI